MVAPVGVGATGGEVEARAAAVSVAAKAREKIIIVVVAAVGRNEETLENASSVVWAMTASITAATATRLAVLSGGARAMLLATSRELAGRGAAVMVGPSLG